MELLYIFFLNVFLAFITLEDRVVIACSLCLGQVSGNNLLFHLSCTMGSFHDEPCLKFTFEL